MAKPLLVVKITLNKLAKTPRLQRNKLQAVRRLSEGVSHTAWIFGNEIDLKAEAGVSDPCHLQKCPKTL